MEVLSPRRSRLTVLSNGKTLWKYSPSINKEKPIVNKSSASGFRFLRVFDLLQKGLKNNKNFTVKTDGLKKRVIFTENFSNEINYAEIILNFKTEKFIFSNIDYLNLIKINGRVTKLSLSKIKKNITIPKSRFNYN
jgi:outer membrane lipoprotein-sorting protein